MTDELHAIIGRKQLQLENLDAEYTKLLQLLKSVVTGEIDRDRVEVDLENRSWAVIGTEAQPAEE